MTMEDRSFLDEFTILLLDDSTTRLELFDDWLPGVTTRFATQPSDVPEKLDATCVVAILAQSVLGDDEAKVRKFALNRSPYCQLVLILPRQSFVSPLEDSYDACLRRPVFRDELQETVERRLKCGVYSASLEEYYHLNAELVGLAKSGDSSVVPDGKSPQWLTDRHEQLEDRLAFLETALDFDDMHSIVQSMELHDRYLTEPEDDVQRSGGSKYHPDRCPNCKLPWGVDHRNKLGQGFSRAGAHVWKCARCNEIVHGVGSSHRRISW